MLKGVGGIKVKRRSNRNDSITRQLTSMEDALGDKRNEIVVLNEKLEKAETEIVRLKHEAKILDENAGLNSLRLLRKDCLKDKANFEEAEAENERLSEIIKSVQKYIKGL